MKRLLLDTHAALWWWSDPSKLSDAARSAIAGEANEVAVSAASAWEIATKFRIGKLPDICDPSVNYPRLMRRSGFASLTASEAHAIRAGLLDGAHRDPFDRLIAAQALIEDMELVSCDPKIAAFGCKVLW